MLSGRSAIALDATGVREAVALGEALSATSVTAILSSPRRRARETAAAIADRRGLAVVSEPAFDEIDFGALAGRSFAELDGDPDWARWNGERGSARCPGGETMGEASARAWRMIEGLAPGITLCVTHCDVIRALVCDVLGLGYDRMFQLGCDPASVTELAIDGGGMRVVATNRRYGAV